jgi:tetratricopeptide (TPR) repeat protein
MHFIQRAALFLSAMALPTPLIAADLPDLKKLSDKELIALYDKVRAPKKPDFCNQLSPVLAELLKRPGIQGALQDQKILADFNCALKEGNWTTAYRLMPDTEDIIGESLDSLGFLIALFSDHPENAAERLSVLAAASDGEEFLSISEDSLFQLLRDLWVGKHFAARAATADALMKSPHFKKLSADLQSSMAGAIIDEEGRLGRFERSGKLLDKIDSPYRFMDFLSMREYAPIWPQVEKAAGANLSNVLERQLKKDLAAYKKAPDDRQAFQSAAHALLFAGQFENVISHVSSFDHSEANIANATEDDAWALNVEAYALDALGRKAEAEAIFDKIAAIPYDPDKNGWLVNFTINRGSRLVELGQWEKGLEAATLAGTITEKSGSLYAKMLVRRDKICALNKLGRADEAKPLVEEIFELRKESYTTAATGLLCAGDIERAAQIIVEGLSDPVHSSGVAGDLQKPEFQLFYTQSKLPSLRETLLPRADVRAAFEKVAREIPDGFIPLAGKRRAEMNRQAP